MNEEQIGNPAPLTCNFRQGVSIESVVVKKLYKNSDKTLQVRITLENTNNKNIFVNNKKDITITFGGWSLENEINKLQILQ